MQDIRYALRLFKRAPLVALTIVATVGLGLGLVAAVFTILNAFVFQADEVRDPNELFAIERQSPAEAEPRGFTRAQYESLVRETGVFSQAFARTPDIDAWINGRRMEGSLVTGNFFQVLGVTAVLGRAITPADDTPGGGQPIVLSHRTWTQSFASDPAVVGRTVLVNGTSFEVVGVMPVGFRALTVAAPDFWAPLSTLQEFRRDAPANGDAAVLHIVGRLKPELTSGRALPQLDAWDGRRAAEHPAEPRAAKLMLEPRPGTVPLTTDVLVLFTPFFFAFGLVLMIGSANVANLLFARGVARQREIGVRVAIGVSRGRIIRQLLVENLVLALVAAAIGFVISRLVLGIVVYALSNSWSLAFGNIRVAAPPADWRVGLFLIAGATMSTLFFALAPALHATRIEVVRAIRGEIVRDARPGRARDALVALQVAGSSLLLICSVIFLRSALAAASVDPGIRTADIVTVDVLDEQKRAAILDAVRGESLVGSIAASWPGGLGGRTALAEVAGVKSTVTYQSVSREYFDVLGIDLVRGRRFSETERGASDAVTIVSEHVAREFWPQGDAIGQVMRLEPDTKNAVPERDDPLSSSRSFVVVGVAREVPGFRLGGVRLAGPGIYLPASIGSAKTMLAMRVQGDVERARQALVNRFAAIDPNMAEVSTLQTIARLESYLLGIPFWLTLVLGTLALMLTVSGLFSVLSYLVAQRTREIGVRMALGATRGSIAELVLSQTVRPVVLGLLLGCTLAAALGASLLATPAAALISATVRLFDPIAYGASVVCTVAACVAAALIPALRAGRIDPVGALKNE